MYSHSLRTSRKCTEKGFRTAMGNLQMRLDEAIVFLEKVYLEFTPAMIANSLDPVLAFNCRLDKSHDEVIHCRTAIDRLISSNAEHYDVGSKDYVKSCRLIDENTFTMVTEGGQRISLFESKSSSDSKSSRTNSRSSCTSRSRKSCSLEEKEIILKY